MKAREPELSPWPFRVRDICVLAGEFGFPKRTRKKILGGGANTSHLPLPGNKKDNVNIVYTPWSNLKKDGSMAVGQVGFKDQRKVKKVLVEARTNAIINRLNKTKTEAFPDLAVQRDERDRTIRDREKKLMLERVRILSMGPVLFSLRFRGGGVMLMLKCDIQKKEEARVAKERREKAWQKDHAYDDVFTEEAMEENLNDRRDANFYDDFM